MWHDRRPGVDARQPLADDLVDAAPGVRVAVGTRRQRHLDDDRVIRPHEPPSAGVGRPSSQGRVPLARPRRRRTAMGPARPVPASIFFKFLLSFLLFIELVSASLLGMAMGTAAEPLQVLREAIEDLDLAVHGDAIAEVRELIDRLEARVAIAEAEYSAKRAGRGRRVPEHGRLPPRSGRGHPHRVSADRGPGEAARGVARSSVPRGATVGISGAQVDLMCAKVPERHVERFAATIDDTIGIIGPLTAHHTGIVLHPLGVTTPTTPPNAKPPTRASTCPTPSRSARCPHHGRWTTSSW